MLLLLLLVVVVMVVLKMYLIRVNYCVNAVFGTLYSNSNKCQRC